MAFIYNLTDTWNDAATTWNGIKLAVTNSGSDASSKLLNLTVTGATTASFVVDKSGNLALNGTVNKITMTAPATGATLTLADNSTFITSGAYSSTFTFTGATTLTFPTSGTVTALGNTTTGSGSIVLATGPTITLTNATGLPLSTGVTGTLAIANGGTGQTTANAAFNALVPSQTGNNGKYLTTDGSNTSWATNPLGTVTSVDVSGGTTGLSFSGGPITTAGTITMAGTLAAANGGTGLTSLGSGIATWLGTPSSANLAAAVTDETGSGALVFGTSPTIGSPTITGTATFNGSTSGTVALKAPAVAGTTTFQLPSGNGTSGYVLVTDGLGNTSWAASGGAAGNAAGLNKNVQFNDAGSMAGNAAFNFDKATYELSVGIASTTSGKLALYNSSSANAVTVASGNNSVAWTFTLPTTAGTNGQALTTDGSGNATWTTIQSGLTVGSTAISGGTSGRILYDNAGTLGEKAVTGTGDVVLATSPTLITPNLGTPSAATLTNATGLPISTGVSGLGSGVATFLATPTSANLASAVTDETGTGSLVFSNSPTFNDDITLGVASTATGAAKFVGTTSGLVTLSVADAAGTWTMKLPTTAGTNGNVLVTDGSGNTSWSGAGTGDVVGPASATDNAIVRFDTTTGKLVQNSAVTIADTTGDISTPGTLAMGYSFKRNRIINGDMRVDQRNNGVEVNPAVGGGYSLDRWLSISTAASKFKIGQNAGSVTPPTGFTNYIGLTSLSAYTPATSEGFGVLQRIEGYNVSDLAWGTANAKTVTLSFWVYSSLTGTFGGSVRNGAGNRSYVFSYTINAANTWEYKTATIVGDTTGTWINAAGIGLSVLLTIGAASNVSTTAGSWVAGNYFTVTGATSVVGTSGATFYITGVQLETGSIATPYERQIYSEQLAQCQRYYYRYTAAASDYLGMAYGISATVAYVFVRFPVTMRIAPTAVEQSGTATNYLVSRCGAAANTTCSSVPTIQAAYTWGAVTNFNVASGLLNNNAGSGYTTAYLGWSAEL